MPFEGVENLLRLIPSPRLPWSLDVSVGRDEISFDVVDNGGGAKSVKREANSALENLRKQLEYLEANIAKYNSELEGKVTDAVRARKAKLERRRKTAESLGVKVRRAANVPTTFSVSAPKPKVRVQVERPAASKPAEPEPTLEESSYLEILGVIHEVSKQIERLPSTYSRKSEENLRDMLLLLLEANFEASATGETYNKAGKTDILLRHEGKNLFIAECKFWSGPKGLIEAVGQLLGYLTWRDSKAALIVFVRNKGFSQVLDSAKKALPEHPNWQGQDEVIDDTWIRCRLSLEGDPDRTVYTSVMFYHVPEGADSSG